MTSEKTPLKNLVIDGFNNINNEQAKHIASATLDRMKNLSKKAMDGDRSIRFLALLAAMFIFVTSATGIISSVFTFHFVNAVLDIYLAFFGVLIIVLESNQTQLAFGGPMLKSIHTFLSKNFQIFDFVTGRGCFYFFTGTLKLTQHDILSLISGSFMCFVGFIYCVFGHRAYKMLKNAQKETRSDEELKLLFNGADKDNSNTIDCDEFKFLIQALGLELSSRETELAFMLMDKDDDRKIEFVEFKTFWKHSHNDETSFSMLV